MTAEIPRYGLITGAAGGIGQALVDSFSDAGYRVIATDRGLAPPDLRCAHYLSCDLRQFVDDEDYAGTFIDAVADLLGDEGLHVLINNAAVQVLGGVDGLSRDDWRATLDVNLLAPFLMSQALLPQLAAAGGSVVNVSSIHAKLTKANFVAYATSKAALSGMTRAMAVDLGPRVRVNAIEPAAIDTPMLQEGFGFNQEKVHRLAACHPVGRIARVEEIAHAALALADDQMQFLSGACIDFSGAIAGRLHDVD